MGSISKFEIVVLFIKKNLLSSSYSAQSTAKNDKQCTANLLIYRARHLNALTFANSKQLH